MASVDIGKIYKNKFGDLIVTSKAETSIYNVRFIDTGYEREARSHHIRRGSVKDLMRPSCHDVGFIGDKGYSATKDKSAYKSWSHMIERCYSDVYHTKKPTYKDCEVCEEWQEFGVYAEWYYENYPCDGLSYELDKDIKIDGNKIYSPEACIFVTKEENSRDSGERLCNNFSIVSPDGDVHHGFNISRFARENDMRPASLRRVITGERPHHKGWRLYNANK